MKQIKKFHKNGQLHRIALVDGEKIISMRGFDKDGVECNPDINNWKIDEGKLVLSNKKQEKENFSTLPPSSIPENSHVETLADLGWTVPVGHSWSTVNETTGERIGAPTEDAIDMSHDIPSDRAIIDAIPSNSNEIQRTGSPYDALIERIHALEEALIRTNTQLARFSFDVNNIPRDNR